ncbi:class I SAM-dependent methyltransferase [Virgibacillus alimentarius]|uniref:16S rRNA C1402 N4-methylase RsmH n=1 Tax=Virgibacillus alimentarius TaxID=698769 RepID=A0ABS4S788_9BACI|nr:MULTISPECIES: class I SAM-dependent methyltransferase [Virgibacillus]MBP2257274.1 16S rRNA C1402 N4-methylase RsmH [Virgibacillus alimentarius]HLR67837.1 class I SAM-dependent methyltransferase [Virgibacillus sp.]
MLKGILNYSHYLLALSTQNGETVIDATCGNGNDTLFLSKKVGKEGHVLAFDIQDQAIKNAKALVEGHNCSNISFIHDSHVNVSEYLSSESKVGAAIFNLGYLPKSDKTIITQGESTISSIKSILGFLRQNGLIVIVVYHGHKGGKKEKEMILSYVMNLDQKKYHVLRYDFINQKNNPPFLLAIQKK